MFEESCPQRIALSGNHMTGVLGKQHESSQIFREIGGHRGFLVLRQDVLQLRAEPRHCLSQQLQEQIRGVAGLTAQCSFSRPADARHRVGIVQQENGKLSLVARPFSVQDLKIHSIVNKISLGFF